MNIEGLFPNLIPEFSLTVSGGIAIYMIACTLMITGMGFLELFEYIKTFLERK